MRFKAVSNCANTQLRFLSTTYHVISFKAFFYALIFIEYS